MSGGSLELELLDRCLEVWIVAINQLCPCQSVVHVCNELPPALQFSRILHSSHRIVFMAILAQENHRHAFLLERSEEHTSELQSLRHLVCRLLLEKIKL